MFALALALLLVATTASATTLLVDADRPAGGDGLAWATAFADLQDALDAARADGNVDEIWVAEGTYLADRGSQDRDDSFALVSAVALYGGFAGDEDALADRDPVARPTVLSGDLQNNDLANFGNRFDNSRHVVTGIDLAGAVIDGFVIRGGNADFDGDLLLGGGGMFITSSGEAGGLDAVVVRDCTFGECSAGRTFSELGNFGGALMLRGASGTVTGCRFEGNRANSGGAIGLFGRNAAEDDVDVTIRIDDCEFVANRVPTQIGGAIYSALGHSVIGDAVATLAVERCRFIDNAAGYWGAWCDFNTTFLTVADCEFTGNASDVHGGALGHIQTGGPDEDPAQILRCTFRDNQTDGAGGGLWLGAADAVVRECVFRNNRALTGGGGVVTTTYFTQGGAQDFTAVNCLFAANNGNDGAALLSADNPLLRLVNCTFVDNAASGGPTGGVATNAGNVDVDNAIFRGNTGTLGGGEAAQIRHVNGGPLSVAWSLVHGLTGGFGGQGNLDGDPLLDEDLRPGAGSPCIDAGNNLAATPFGDTDQSGQPRFVDDPDTPDTGQGDAPLVDMGALEFQATLTGIDDDPRFVAAGGGVAIPNPADGTAAIFFRAALNPRCAVAVHDVSGARVRTLASGIAAIAWDGRDDAGRRVPAGVYFVRAETVAGPATVRIVRLR